MWKIWVAIFLAAGSSFAAHPKIAADLITNSRDKTVDVIVQYKHAPTPAHDAKVRSLGGVHKHGFEMIRSGHYSMPAAKLQALADDPEVEFIHPDREVTGTAFAGKVDYRWMTATGTSSIHGSLPYDGTGIGVAIIDSGMDPHEDFKDDAGKMRIAAHQSIVPNDNRIGDSYGQGNYVAGVVWGTSSMRRFSIVWGSTAVWGVSSTAVGSTSIALSGEN